MYGVVGQPIRVLLNLCNQRKSKMDGWEAEDRYLKVRIFNLVSILKPVLRSETH